MPSRKDKKYYAVARGVTEGIYSSWAKACALTSSYPGSLHKGFPSYEEAEAYMLEHGCNNFFVDHELPSDRKRSGEKYYAVAHGRKNGVFDVYEGQAQPQVHKYPDACHQAFDTSRGADKHIRDFEEFWAIRSEIENLMNIEYE